MKNLIYTVLIFIFLPALSFAQLHLKGMVIDSVTRQPLAGASIILKGTKSGTQTVTDGSFDIPVPTKQGTIIISYVGYRPVQFPFDNLDQQVYSLSLLSANLKEIAISTGYQQIPAERATGSFVSIDNNLLNRRVSTDILSRLEDVTPGLVFNRNVPGRVNDITIRGQSTLFSNAQPLIILDNFPYDGDLTNINPNDVENITVLKDAAAASIWGSRAGNGVIVITTKKGSYNNALHVSFNSNVTVGDKPDLFYQSKMSTSDFIDVEKLLFSRGFFRNAENSPSHAPITPVVELLIAARDGNITQSAANTQIDALRSNCMLWRS